MFLQVRFIQQRRGRSRGAHCEPCQVKFALAMCRFFNNQRKLCIGECSLTPRSQEARRSSSSSSSSASSFLPPASCSVAAGVSSAARQTLSSSGSFSLPGQLRKLHQYVNDLIFKHLKKPLINIDLNTCHQ